MNALAEGLGSLLDISVALYMLVGLLLGGCLLVPPAAAEKPLNRSAVSPECLRLLDGLSRGDVGPQDLAACLRETGDDQGGWKKQGGGPKQTP